MERVGGGEVTTRGDDLRDRFAFDVFHDEKRRVSAVPCRAKGLVDDGNAVMPERAKRRRLSLEQLVRLPLVQCARMQRLERDEPVVPYVAGKQRLRKRTAAEWTDHLVPVGDSYVRVRRGWSPSAHEANVRLRRDGIPGLAAANEIPPMPAPLVARRVLSADHRGSSWPVLVETDGGLRFTKLRGAGHGTAALVAEMIVATLAEAIGLNVPARSLVEVDIGIESLDRDGELRALLDASVGVNLGFSYLESAHVLRPEEIARVSRDDAAAIVWLDRFVMNPDRSDRNPNLMLSGDKLWLIDHGAALGFQYAWSSVTESSPRRPDVFEPHVLRDRVTDLAEWDTIFATRMERDVIERAVAEVPDGFLEPLASDGTDALRRRRAAYSAFLWKRLKAPRDWLFAEPLVRQRRAPSP